MEGYIEDIIRLEQTLYRFLSRNILFIILGFGIIYYLFRAIGADEIISSLKSIPYSYIMLVFFMYAAAYLIQIRKWKTIIDVIGSIKYVKLIPIYLGGGLFNQLTPGATCGGQPYRAYYAAHLNRRSIAKNLSTTIFDFTTIAIFHSILLTLSFAYLFSSMFNLSLFLMLLVMIVVIVLLLFGITMIIGLIAHKSEMFLRVLPLVYHIRLLRKRFKTYKKFKLFVKREIKIFFDEMLFFFQNKPLVAKALLYDLVIWSIYASQFYILFYAIGVKVSIVSVLIVMSLGQLTNLIMITPGGIGIVEAMMIGVFSFLGVPAASAAVVTSVNRVMLYIYEFGFGYASYMYLRSKR